ncbi:MAG: winged helix-turn-helix domain-containing protein [Bryobacteraceae bacterium]
MLGHTPERTNSTPIYRGGDQSLGSKEVRLTRKESQLLALLQQNAGKCLSRAYLLETIWGYTNGTKTRTLDVHIQRLRRKLGPDKGRHIVTVLRAGYAWQEMPGISRVEVH